MHEGRPPITRFRIGTYLAFFVGGFTQAMWAPLIPYVQQRLAVNDAQLGLLLLCLGLGSLLSMPVTGAIAAKRGAKPVMVLSGLVMVVSLPVIATSASLPVVVVALFLFGAGLGSLDVAMNIHAVEVEAMSDKPLMSGFHAQYSIGGFVGAGIMTLMLTLGASAALATLIGVTCSLLIVFGYGPLLLTRKAVADGSSLAVPRGVVVLLSVMAFLMFLAEGAVLDWSAVFMVRQDLVPEAQGGIGYMAFAIAMTVGRLTGDRLVAWLGRRRFLLLGGTVAAVGFLAVTVSTVSWLAIAGFVLVGLGASNVVPVLISLAGMQKDMPAGMAVAAIATLGYAGILIGPAAIGFIANAAGLPFSFLLLAALCAAVPFLSVLAYRRLNGSAD